MNVEISPLVEGARNAKGIVVIIDVLRACTTMPILFERGANKIVPVSTPEDAAQYEGKGYVLIGEGEQGAKHDVFHHINSPSDVYREDFTGKNIAFRSNNATQAILNAENAEDVILASFVNVDAVVGYIKKKNISQVTLVPLGRLGKRGDEDDLCAEKIKNSLAGVKTDFDEMRKRIEDCECAVLVRDTLKKPEDVVMALRLNSYPIVPRVIEEDGVKTIVKSQ